MSNIGSCPTLVYRLTSSAPETQRHIQNLKKQQHRIADGCPALEQRSFEQSGDSMLQITVFYLMLGLRHRSVKVEYFESAPRLL